MTDALGRLSSVIEDPTTGGLNYQTSYAYDVLDDLTTVTQGALPQRTFQYDSLKRLTSATNPESGTVSYQYDNNSNVTRKTDARSTPSYTTYIYDALNRLTQTNYWNGTSVDRRYDGAVNGRGRFWYAYAYSQGNTRIELTATDNYDVMGRPLNYRRQFYTSGVWSAAYTVQRTYDLAGHVLLQTYPSGHTASYTYDLAGRTQSFIGTIGDGSQRTYATGIIYSPWNSLSQEQFGTTVPVYNNLFYTSRGQLAEIRESTTANDTSWNRGAIINHYSNQCWGMCSGYPSTDNNGSIKKQDNYIPDNEQVSSYVQYTDYFTYDSLDRLQAVREDRYQSGAPGATTVLNQAYTLDQYGNRTINTASTWGGINSQQFTVDTTTNRLGVPAGMGGVMQCVPSEARLDP